eukprot:TRINITY_DN39445_c0_g1_i1.p1 TRINITY_DN39445_c0_g1~~TRINITY_DN39445_c0_g1_i1.p1  ORF type:complete len:430 (+),score=250.80 TRINITY_DN39445_c0_g1_i1:64-1353(+)
MGDADRKTIRFEDLGAPIQKLLKSLKGGVSDEDMELMEYVSVKDMAKIYNDLASDKKAELIWKELREELQRRKDEREGRVEERRAAREDAERLRKKMEEAAEEEQRLREEEERLKAERKARKKAEKERRRREQEDLERQLEEERLQQEAEEEAQRLEEEERQRKKEERRRRREQREAELQARQEEEERLAREEAEAEQRRIEEKLRKKEEKRRRREEEAERLAEQEAALEREVQEERKARKKRDGKTQKEAWEEHVKSHPLEFAGSADEEIEIKQERRADQVTHKKPEAFMKIKAIRIPVALEEGDHQAFQLEVHVNGKADSVKVTHRYSEFADLRKKLGATADACAAPFPGKGFFKLKGAALDKRRQELEAWMQDLLDKFTSQRIYGGVHLDKAKEQLRGDMARAEAERQRMQQAAAAKSLLDEFCGV